MNSEKDINWAFRATIVALVANAILVVMKFSVGFLINSLSLTADGFDSALDLLTALVAYVGFILANRPPDEDHHYGHNQLEALFSLVLTVLLFSSAYLILDQGLFRLFNGIELEFNALGLLTAVVSILTKIVIAYYIITAGQKVNSPAIIANGKNYRTDAITSLLVCFAIIGAYFGFGWLDALLAVVICALLFYTGVEIAKSSFISLLEVAPPKEFVQKVCNSIESIPLVTEAHNLRLRYQGNRIIGDVHVLVDPDLTVLIGHNIAEEIQKTVEKRFNTTIIVHIEPNIPSERMKETKSNE